METLHRGITLLLRSAITGEKLLLPEDFDINDVEDETKRHSLQTLIFEGAILCGADRTSPVMQRLFQQYCMAMMKSEGQMRDVQRVTDAFRANGIDYMPLKGCKMKTLYRRPELRLMGDADILIRTEQYDKIKPIMESLGFTARASTDHELVWTTKSLYLELHKRLIPSYNKDFYEYFGDGWSLAKREKDGSYALSVEMEFVYLFTHFTKHYRDGGIGCRHMVDLWVYLRAHPEMDLEKVEWELEKLGLLYFYRNIVWTLRVWFAEESPCERTDFITEFIFSSGNWGVAEARVISMAVRDSRHTESATVSRMSYVLRALFPNVEMLKFKYPVLQKASWMLPLVWLYRPFYKVLFEWKSVRQHGANLAGMTRQKLTARQEALKYVGLDYNF